MTRSPTTQELAARVLIAHALHGEERAKQASALALLDAFRQAEAKMLSMCARVFLFFPGTSEKAQQGRLSTIADAACATTMLAFVTWTVMTGHQEEYDMNTDDYTNLIDFIRDSEYQPGKAWPFSKQEMVAEWEAPYKPNSNSDCGTAKNGLSEGGAW